MAKQGLFTSRDKTRLGKAVAKLEKRKNIDIKIIPLGGQSAIGVQNCWLIIYKNIQILLDCGRKIANLRNYDKGEIPNHFNPDYSKIDFSKPLYVILSHGHLDHILGLVKLVQLCKECNCHVAIYGAEKTIKVAKRVLRVNKLIELETLVYDFIEFNTNSYFQVAEIIIESFEVFHSIPGSVGLVLTIEGKKIVYLTDFKYCRDSDPQIPQTSRRFQKIGKQNIDTLIVDVTGIIKNGWVSPVSLVTHQFREIFEDKNNAEKRIFITTFASDIQTIGEIADLANVVGGRLVEFDGATMKFFAEDIELENQDQYTNPPVIFVTGSQGEKGSSLGKIAKDDHFIFELNDNDLVVFTSATLGQNALQVEAMIASLEQQGASVLIARHESGHGARKDIIQAVLDFLPDVVIPCHAGRANRAKLKEIIEKDEFLSSRVTALLLEDGDSYQM